MVRPQLPVLYAAFLNLLVSRNLGSLNLNCPPAEEENASNLSINLSPSLNGTLTLIKNKLSVLYCSVISLCEVFDKLNYNVTVLIGKSSVSVIFTINNNSRTGKNPTVGKWSSVLSLSGDNRFVQTCDLKIFVKADNIQCSKHISDGKIVILCKTERIFPHAKCSFVVKMDEEVYNISDDITSHSEVNVIKGQIYYKSTCSFSMNLKFLMPGTYKVNVNMFPNVSGELRDRTLGTERSFLFNLERPKIFLDKCPLVLDEGEQAYCQCKTLDTNTALKNVAIQWYNNRTGKSENNSSKLIFTASRLHSDYYCMAVNDIELISLPVIYHPVVLKRSENVTCSKHVWKSLLEVLCYTKRVFPTAKCISLLKKNEVKILHQDSFIYNHTKQPGELTYFISQCTQQWPMSSLTPGNYSLDVTMYPDVNSSEYWINYGTKTALNFSLVKNEHVSCSRLTETNHGVNITCKTSGIHHEGWCSFVITKSEVIVYHPNIITYIHQTSKDNHSIDSSECNLFIPSGFLSHGKYNVVITVFSVSMEAVDIIILNATKSFIFDIGIVEDRILYIIISAASLAFIIVLVILAVIYKKMKVAKIKTNSGQFSRCASKKKSLETTETDEHVYELIHEYANDPVFASELSSDETPDSLMYLNRRSDPEYITPL